LYLIKRQVAQRKIYKIFVVHSLGTRYNIHRDTDQKQKVSNNGLSQYIFQATEVSIQDGPQVFGALINKISLN
jgi:hypothetical protein